MVLSSKTTETEEPELELLFSRRTNWKLEEHWCSVFLFLWSVVWIVLNRRDNSVKVLNGVLSSFLKLTDGDRSGFKS